MTAQTRYLRSSLFGGPLHSAFNRNLRLMLFAGLRGSYRFQQAITGIRNFPNCPLECFLIRPGGFVKSADFAHELQRSTIQLLRSCGLSRLS